jgi:membrane protease YdiL (CAAX protease family)
MVVDREVTMNETPTPPSAPPPSDGAPPPAPGLGPLRAVGIFAAFLGIQVVVVLVAGVVAGLGHIATGEGSGGFKIAPGFLLGAAVAGTALGGLVVLWMARRALPGALAVIGWAPASVRACARAALQGLGIVLALGLVGAFLPPPRDAGPLGRLDQLGTGARVAGALLAFVAAPMVEELLFRGVLYTGLARRWPRRLAGATTTLIFVALHVLQIGAYWPGWLFIGLVGALALRARVASGSLLPAIALHATYNLGLILAAVAAGAAR